MPRLDQVLYPTESACSRVEPAPIHAVLACRAVIAAWDRRTDGSPVEEARCDDVLQAAVAYAAAVVKAGRCPSHLVEEMSGMIAVISADEPTGNIPNLTFDEAIEPLRLFVAVSGLSLLLL